MKRASQAANLIAPMVSIDHIPDFFEVSLRFIMIDGREMRNGGDCYKVQGGLALGKSALAKLALAARISWDSQKSGRIDDGSDVHYVHFRAVGYWPDFDGRTLLEISGEKRLDLRDGSAMVEKLDAEARRNGKDATARIREMRAFILEHAESRARNRAIRQALALKSSYSEEELKKPFVVPTLTETGRCDDPEIRRMYLKAKLEGKGLATRALYGGSDPLLRPGDSEIFEAEARPVDDSIRKPLPQHTPQPPPPVSTDDDDDDDGEGGPAPAQVSIDPFNE